MNEDSVWVDDERQALPVPSGRTKSHRLIRIAAAVLGRLQMLTWSYTRRLVLTSSPLRDSGICTSSQTPDIALDMSDAKIKKEDVPNVYGKIAPIYDIWAWLTERDARSRCLELAAIQDGEIVLEVAVGTGLAFVKILEANPSGHTEGIDLTSAMVAIAEKRALQAGYGSYRLRLGDAYDLQFSDDTFDVLVNNYMFDLLPERDFSVVLEEFKRVLRPGGRLAIVNMAHGRRWYNGIWNHLYRVSPALLGGCRSISLLPLLQQCGFRDTKREYISQFTFPSEVVFGIAP